MTRRKGHSLTAEEIELIRLVARGLTDRQIAGLLNIKLGSLRSRINHVYHRTGIPVGGDTQGTAGITRLRLVVWAYENGVVGKGQPAPLPKSAREQALADRAFAVLRGLVFRKPLPLLRDEAVAIIREVDAEATIEAHVARQAAA